MLDLAAKTQVFEVRERFGNGHAACLAVVPAVAEELFSYPVSVLRFFVEQGQNLLFALVMMLGDLGGTLCQAGEWLSMSR